MAQILVMAAVMAAMQVATHYLFAPKTKNGPRLGDLNVTTSTYGNPINILEGTARLNGNLIWAHPLFEGTDGGGGKGGGSPTTYFYNGTFAIAFCKGPVGAVLRIWADGKLVWDHTQPGQVPSGAGDYFHFNFHSGAEDQTPDPLIASFAGEENTPAYRGLCYIVFNFIPLANYGNRIPNFTAELSVLPTVATKPLLLTALTDNFVKTANFDGLRYTADWVGSWAYFAKGNVFGSAPLSTMVQNMETTVSDLCAGLGGTPAQNVITNMVMGADGNLYFGCDGNFSSSGYYADYNSIVCVNPQGRQLISAFPNNFYIKIGGPDLNGSGQPNDAQDVNDLYAFNTTTIDDAGNGQYILGVDNGSNFYVLGGHASFGVGYFGPTTLFDGQYERSSAGYPYCCPGIAADGYCDVYIVRQLDNEDIGLSKIRVYQGVGQAFTRAEYSDVYVLTDNTITQPDQVGSGTSTTITGIGSPLYDSSDDTVVFSMSLSNSHKKFVKFSEADGVVWNTLVQPQTVPGSGDDGTPQEFEWLGTILTSASLGASSIIQGGQILNFSEGYVTILEADSGVVSYSGTVAGYANAGDAAQVFDGQNGDILTAPGAGLGLVLLEAGRNTQTPTTLGAIVTDIMSRCDFEPDEYDCSQLTQNIDGYVITRVDTGAAMLTQLMNIFLINVIESDWTLKFLPRGQGVIATITEDDLIRLDDKTAEPYKETRKQDLDMPWRVTMSYLCEALDYQTDTQQASRAITPDPTMFSLNIDDVQVSVVMGPTEAKQICEILLYTVWMARHTFQVRTSKKFSWLDAADSVILQLNTGYQLQLRLTNMDLGSDLTVDSLLEAEDYLTLTSNNNASTPLFSTQQIIQSPMVVVFMLDINLLRDSDDDATETVTYTGLGLPQITPSWAGAQLQKSANGTEFSSIENFFTATPWGYVNAAPPDPVGSPYYTQKASMVVSLVSGGDSLSSTTYAGLCQGLNGFVVFKQSGGFEILQFQNLTQIAATQYQLGTLRRGCQGSDTMAGGIQPGDKVVFLSSNWLQVYNQAISQMSVTAYFEGLGYGSNATASSSIAFASTENNKKPYAPVALTCTSDGSGGLTLSWVRRSRVNAILQDGTGTTPLGEANESYALVIYTDSTAATAVRSVTVTNTDASVNPTFDYTESEITADLGALPATLTFSVAQISAVVGDGYTRYTTLETA